MLAVRGTNPLRHENWVYWPLITTVRVRPTPVDTFEPALDLLTPTGALAVVATALVLWLAWTMERAANRGGRTTGQPALAMNRRRS